MSDKEAQVDWDDDGRDFIELRECNICGEEWIDAGDPDCPHCGSDDTQPVDEEEQCNPAN